MPCAVTDGELVDRLFLVCATLGDVCWEMEQAALSLLCVFFIETDVLTFLLDCPGLPHSLYYIISKTRQGKFICAARFIVIKA